MSAKSCLVIPGACDGTAETRWPQRRELWSVRLNQSPFGYRYSGGPNRSGSASIAPLRFKWACFHSMDTAKEKPEFPSQEGLGALNLWPMRAFHQAYPKAAPILSQAVTESPFRKRRNPGSCLPQTAEEGLPRSTCQRWSNHARTASMSPAFRSEE